MLGDDLRVALSMAIEHARDHRHAYLTTEHLLLGLLHDPQATEVMVACGANLDALEAAVTESLKDQPTETEDEAYDPIQTTSFRRVIQRAIMHVQRTGKLPVTGANVLVALFAEEDSQAVFLLEEQGITRVAITRFLSHGIRGDGKPAESKRPEGTGPDAEDAPPEPSADATGAAGSTLATNTQEELSQ